MNDLMARMAEALRGCQYIVALFASKNPKWKRSNGNIQDPAGAHALHAEIPKLLQEQYDARPSGNSQEGCVSVPLETLRNWMLLASCGPGGLRRQIEPYVVAAPSDASVSLGEAPRCPKCGYSYDDCRLHMDHNLCGEPTPSPQREEDYSIPLHTNPASTTEGGK